MKLSWMLVLGAAVISGACDDGETGGTAGAGGAEVDAAIGGGGGGDGGASDDAAVVDMGGDPCEVDGDCQIGAWCEFDQAAFEGVCRSGCRTMGESGCPDRFICNADDRRCIPDPNCIADTECAPDAYCQDGDCLPGCRLPPNEVCPANADGLAQACNPATRACEPLVPCCDDGCTFKLADRCDDRPNEAFDRCVNPNPCEGRCSRDRDCPNDAYCDTEVGLCADGCRLDDPLACVGQICDPETRRCAPIPCDADDACPEEQYCDLPTQGCRFGCRTRPDSCGRNLFCNAARQCGRGCRNDAQCVERNGDGWYCNGESECEAPCRENSDCLDEAKYCNAESARCEVGCRDDLSEPNDDREGAIVLDFGQGERFSGQGYMACERNGDWYRFDTPAAGWTVQVRVRFNHGGGDLDAQLFPPLDAAPILGQSGDDDEVLVGDGAAGTWFLYVYSRGLDRNDYELQIELSPPVNGCQPDEADVAGDDLAEDATVVELPNLNSRVDLERVVCEGDVDWFALDLGAQDGFNARLELLGNGQPGGGELDLAIYGPGLPGPDDEPTFLPNVAGGGINGPRFIEFNAPRLSQQVAAGRYYVRVFGLDEDQWGDYRLRLGVNRAQALCLPDDAEPNDTQITAADVTDWPELIEQQAGVGPVLRDGENLILPDRWICGGGADWYRFVAAEGDDMVVTVRRQDMPVEGDIVVEIRDGAGVVGLPGRSAQPTNTARAAGLEGGVHYVRVAAVVPETQTRYDLQLNRTARPMDCAPDPFDQPQANDTRADARQIAPPGANGLRLCGRDGDVDWFYFDTFAVADISVNLTFLHDQANLELDIFAGDAEVSENAALIAGHTATDGEQVTLEQRLAGRFYVRVSAVGDADAPYELALRVTPRVFQCFDDLLEPNDSFEDASPLGDQPREIRDVGLCDRVPAEVDTFDIIVPGGRQRTVSSTFIYGDDGDMAIEIFDADQMMRVTTLDVPRGNSKQCVVIDAAPGDRQFFVRLVPLSINRIIEDDEELSYRLQIVDGDACDLIGPPTPGIVWPHVSP